MGILAELDLTVKPHAKAANRTEAALTHPTAQGPGRGNHSEGTLVPSRLVFFPLGLQGFPVSILTDQFQ